MSAPFLHCASRAMIGLLCVILLVGCASPRIASQAGLSDQRLNTHAPAGRARVVFFNSSNRAMYGIDKTGRIDIHIDGAAFATVDIGEYAQAFLPKGTHQVHLRHRDMFWMKSDHRLELDRDAKWVRVFCRPLSNALQTTNEPPRNFASDFQPADR